MTAVVSQTIKPLVSIRATRGWSALNFLEVWQFRDLMFTMAGRDLKLRYRQTALGAIWVVAQPLLGAGIFSFIFQIVAGLKSPNGIPFFVFMFAGLMAWGLFGSAVGRTNASIGNNSNLIAKVYFPRFVLPLSSLFSTLIDFTVSLAMMIVLLIIFNIHPGWGLLLLPVWIVLLLLMAMGIGLFAASLSIRYRDINILLPVFMQFLMYGSAVIVATSSIPEKYRFYYLLNPLVSIIEAFKWSLFGVGEIRWNYLIYGAITSVALFLIGCLTFKRMERGFADVI